LDNTQVRRAQSSNGLLRGIPFAARTTALSTAGTATGCDQPPRSKRMTRPGRPFAYYALRAVSVDNAGSPPPLVGHHPDARAEARPWPPRPRPFRLPRRNHGKRITRNAVCGPQPLHELRPHRPSSGNVAGLLTEDSSVHAARGARRAARARGTRNR